MSQKVDMKEKLQRNRRVLTPEEIAVRKRYIGATFVTCIVLALVGGTIHVLDLGSSRMQELRDKAGYDLAEEKDRIRAAGEDLFKTVLHERGVTHTVTFTVEEANGLLPVNEWKRLETTIEIPAGEFTMGTDNKRTDAQNRPAHQVTLPAYYIDKYPVTNAQYARFAAETGYRVPINWAEGRFDPKLMLHPVTMVSWFDAKAYCEWNGKRLPTEAEWEKAARGTDGRRWPWGEVMDVQKLNTYYSVGSTTPVNAYPDGASPYGVMDMAGNVIEWVEDNFEPYSNSNAPQEIFVAKKQVASDDKEDQAKKIAKFVKTDEKYKVVRGGSWKGDPFSTSSYHRSFSWPNLTSDFYGFRCAKDAS